MSLPSGEPADTLTSAESESLWSLWVRFAIQATGEAETRDLLTQALTRLDRPLPLQDEPAITPLRNANGIWVATLRPDLTGLTPFEPDDASNYCRYVSSHFGTNVTWVSRTTNDGARRDWPPDIWSRGPADDVLLHPAVQAVMIWCQA